LERCRRFLILALAVASIAASPADGFLRGAVTLHAQILHPSEPMPSYEVAVIRPLPPGQALPAITQRPGVTTTVGTIKQLIGLAYNLPPLSTVQIVGGPDWLGKDLYLVQAQTDEAMSAKLKGLSPAEWKKQRLWLLQSLLADRLKLQVHFERRELPILAMVVSRGGPKLLPAKEAPLATDNVLPPPMAPGAAPSLKGVRKGFIAYPRGSAFELQGKGLTLDEFAEMLQRQPDVGGRLVVNQTGIAGFFDYTMKWTPDRLTASPAEPVSPAASDEPAFFTALREQIGLRFMPSKGMTEVIVIDHVERPSEN
jgi:bla regulator protein BlaR1